MQMKQEMVNRITNNVLRKVLKDEYNQNIIENLYELFELSNEAILPNKEEVRNRISFLPKKFEVTLDNLIYIRKVGYGVRQVEDMYGPCGALNLETLDPKPKYEEVKTRPGCDEELTMLKNLLDQVLENR